MATRAQVAAAQHTQKPVRHQPSRSAGMPANPPSGRTLYGRRGPSTDAELADTKSSMWLPTAAR